MRTQFRPSRRGAGVVIGLLIFGLIILGGLYISPKAHAPALPPNIPVGVPNQTLRFVAYDLALQPPLKDPMLGEIVKLKADYVLLQNVNEDDSVEIAELLDMSKFFHPQLYQRSERLAGRRGAWGVLTLARQSIYEGAPLGGVRGGFGGWAESVVDGKAFFVANLHLSPGDAANGEAGELESIWKSRSSPPIVLAVLPSDGKPPAGLTFLIRAGDSTGEYFYISKDWKVVAQGSAPNAGAGLAPRYIDVTSAEAK